MRQIKLSIIIPCFNEAKHIQNTLEQLQKTRQHGHEVILSDGGSTDNTMLLSEGLTDHSICLAHGRAAQMNIASNIATGDILLFLHADTITPEDIDTILISSLSLSGKKWGRFDVKLSSKKWPFRIIEALMNIRSCISGIATGDQGIFVYKHVFDDLAGYSNIPLMEDIEICKRLRKTSRPLCIKSHKLITSSRRWEENGITSTVLLMWLLRFRYFLGTPASILAQIYTQKKNT